MSTIEEQIHAYVRERFADQDPLLKELAAAAAKAGLPQISIQPEEGRLLQILLRAIGARRVLEIGTLGGSSAIQMARALPAGGRLITLEHSSKHAAFAREWIARAGLGELVEVRQGAALEVLPHLEREAPFDAVFIDADKENYPAYLDWALRYTRVGGLIIAHNAFYGGRVVEDAEPDAGRAGIQAANQRFASDPRLLSTILFGGDGIAVGLVVGEART